MRNPPLFLTLQNHFSLIHPHLFYHCAFFSKSRFDLHAVKFSFTMCMSVAFGIFLKCKHSTMVPFWVVCMTPTIMLPTALPSLPMYLPPRPWQSPEATFCPYGCPASRHFLHTVSYHTWCLWPPSSLTGMLSTFIHIIECSGASFLFMLNDML